MELIQSENIEAKKYRLIENDGLLELSPENVARVEAMIYNDSDYTKSADKTAGPEPKYTGSTASADKEAGIEPKKYKGSTAFWMVQLKNALITKKDLKGIIKEAVLAVDRDNSTHISSDGCGPDVMTERLLNHSKTLIEELRNRKSGFKLIEELAEETFKGSKKMKNGKTYHPRKNYSFATKFCHYAAYYFFENEPEQDNYSIYDRVLGEVLPLYLKNYGFNKGRSKNGKTQYYTKKDFDTADKYVCYSNLVDELRKKHGISRNGFDHLLWYYHKGRL